LNGVLSTDDLAWLKGVIAQGDFVDGRLTSTLQGKNNLELAVESDVAGQAGARVAEKLFAHPDFKDAAQPLALHTPLISRYEVGMQYPDHFDGAIMGGVRTDVAVTVFLSDLDDYQGGHLVIETGAGVCRYRLPAGDAIVYPASSIHRIEPVTRGVRLVCVLWVQSTVREPSRRLLLSDLRKAACELEGTAYTARLQRTYHNLLRMWAETSPQHGRQ
jgi:PKHD-type hydroxylase